MATADVRRLQRGLNFFVKKYLDGLTPLRVDGQMGRSTRGRIRTVKFYLGYTGPINGKVNDEFLGRLYHPKSVRYSSAPRLARAARRRIEQRRKWKANHRSAVRTTGVGTFDGIPMANIGIPILLWCRAHGWPGTLVSGWRDPQYSRSLCMARCGRPSCPGTCAGTASNHVGTTADRFAMDVSAYEIFRQVVARCPIRPHVHNALPSDRVHFSPSGN